MVFCVKSYIDDCKEFKFILYVVEFEVLELGLWLVVIFKIYLFEVEIGDSWEEVFIVEVKDLICNEMIGLIIGIFVCIDEEEYDGYVGFLDFMLEDFLECD